MRLFLLMLLLFLPSVALADDDLITIQSVHSAPVTVQRLEYIDAQITHYPRRALDRLNFGFCHAPD